MGKEGYLPVSNYREYLDSLKTDEEKLAYLHGVISNSTKPGFKREIMRRPVISREALDFLLDERKKIRSRFSSGQKNRTQQGLAVVFILGMLGGIFLLSVSLTGNVIGSQIIQTSSIIGSILLFIGLIGGFYYLKNKKK